jgi:hypothetical protein
MDTAFEVFVSDTIHGTSDRRTYKTRERAMARYEELTRTHKRNGHSTVILRQGEVQIFPAPICAAECKVTPE